MAIVTTRAVKQDLVNKPAQPLKHVTTREVEVKYIDTPIGKRDDGAPIFKGPESEPVTTHDFEDLAEKNKRDQVAREKEAFEEKQATIRAKTEIEMPKIPGFQEGDVVYQEDLAFSDILIGTLPNGELVGLYDPDWMEEPVRSRK